MVCAHLMSLSAKFSGCVTPAFASLLGRRVWSRWRARVRRPRWAAVRTAPGRLPRTAAARVASRPRTARRSTASAWSGGKVAMRRGAAGVAAQVVEGAVAGDGGGPAAEGVVVAVEGVQVAGDVPPGF